MFTQNVLALCFLISECALVVFTNKGNRILWSFVTYTGVLIANIS